MIILRNRQKAPSIVFAIAASIGLAGCAIVAPPSAEKMSEKTWNIDEQDVIEFTLVISEIQRQLETAYNQVPYIRHENNTRAASVLLPEAIKATLTGTTQTVRSGAGTILAAIPFTGYKDTILSPKLGLSSNATSVQTTTVELSFEPSFKKDEGEKQSVYNAEIMVKNLDQQIQELAKRLKKAKDDDSPTDVIDAIINGINSVKVERSYAEGIARKARTEYSQLYDKGWTNIDKEQFDPSSSPAVPSTDVIASTVIAAFQQLAKTPNSNSTGKFVNLKGKNRKFNLSQKFTVVNSKTAALGFELVPIIDVPDSDNDIKKIKELNKLSNPDTGFGVEITATCQLDIEISLIESDTGSTKRILYSEIAGDTVVTVEEPYTQDKYSEFKAKQEAIKQIIKEFESSGSGAETTEWLRSLLQNAPQLTPNTTNSEEQPKSEEERRDMLDELEQIKDSFIKPEPDGF